MVDGHREEGSAVGSKENDPDRRPPVLVVTWLDAVFELDENEISGTKGGPGITITVGFEIEPRWKAHRSFAGEILFDGRHRAVTHIPEILIIKEEEL